MKTIAICQRKGGNGKSTSCLNLAYNFAALSCKVLIIDLDDQKNSSATIVKNPDVTIEDALCDNDTSIQNCIHRTPWYGVDIICGSENLSGVMKNLENDIGGHALLREKLHDVYDSYDICLIDTSPSLNILVVNALCASDYVFIPLSSKFYSLQGVSQTLKSIQKVQKRLNPALRVLSISFVIHDGRSRLARDVVEKMRQTYPQYVSKTLISQNIKIEEAQVKGLSIAEYAPQDKGHTQYESLAVELYERLQGYRV